MVETEAVDQVEDTKEKVEDLAVEQDAMIQEVVEQDATIAEEKIAVVSAEASQEVKEEQKTVETDPATEAAKAAAFKGEDQVQLDLRKVA